MSLADALDLLTRNKSVGDDVFRSILADPTTKYPAIREAIAVLQEASAKKRIMDKPATLARLVRALAIIVEQEQHVNHLMLSDWAELVRFLGCAYSKLSSEARDLGFVKNVFDLFRAFSILLQADESIDPSCFGIILDACNDFCGQGPQRETSCHQFIMTCMRVLTQLRFKPAENLGSRLLQIGRPRQERLRREMFAYACLIPQAGDDLIAIGTPVIESFEVEFTPASELGLPWFRPSPEADLNRFIAAKALASRKDNSAEPSTKRTKRELDELAVMTQAFSQDTRILTSDLLARSERSFWTFVVLAQRALEMPILELQLVWKKAVMCIQYPECASSACFCLARIVPRLVEPAHIDEVVLARLKALLVTMGESSHPSLSSGSLLLLNSIARVRLLDRDLQRLKTSELTLWLTKSLQHPPESLLNTFFGPECRLQHTDASGVELLHRLESFVRISRFLNTLDPVELRNPDPQYEPAHAVIEFDLELASSSAITVREALWELALLAYTKTSVASLNFDNVIEAVSSDDIKAIVWFASLSCMKAWTSEYHSAARILLKNLNPERLNVEQDVKKSLDVALTLLDDPNSSLAALVAGHISAIPREEPNSALRSLQPIFQAYALQRSPHVAANVLQLLDSPVFDGLHEYSQLVQYFTAFVSRQSPFSRLRAPLSKLRLGKQDLLRLVSGSCTDQALASMVIHRDDDELALALLESVSVDIRKAVSFAMMAQGTSVANMVAVLFKERLLLPADITKITKLMNMSSPQNLIASIATPMLLSHFKDMLPAILEFFGTKIVDLETYHTRFLDLSPQSLSDQETGAVIEEIMRSCSFLSSSGEKMECIRRCWSFLRAHNSVVGQDLLKVYIKGTGVLSRSMAGYHTKLEDHLRLLLADASSIQGYSDLAADIAYMGLPKLARLIYDSLDGVQSNVMRIVWSIESLSQNIDKAPGLLFELLRATGVTFEVWSLVLDRLVGAVQNNEATIDAFSSCTKAKEIAGALQLWSGKLNLDGDLNWMSFMGRLAAEVGDQRPKRSFLGTLAFETSINELLRVYNALPYSHKWHLHSLLRHLRVKAVEIPSHVAFLGRGGSSTQLRYPKEGDVSPIFIAAAKLCNAALRELDLPELQGSTFEEIPELVNDFVPLLVGAKMRPQHKIDIVELLLRDTEQRNLALRCIQRCYEATKEIVCDELTVISACKLSASEFAELGIGCVEILWGRESPSTLSTNTLKDLEMFYALSQDHDPLDIDRSNSEKDTGLSDIRVSSRWRKLDLDLVSFEANGEGARLHQSLTDTGLWNVAYKASGSANFYDYKEAWWLQQWDLPPSFDTGIKGPIDISRKQDRIYCPLYDHFSGHISEAEAFARLARIDLSMPSVLKHMTSGSVGNTDLSVIFQGREILARRNGSEYALAKELQGFTAQLRDANNLFEAGKYALRLERLAAGQPNDSPIRVMSVVESSHLAWVLGDQSLAISLLHRAFEGFVLDSQSQACELRRLGGDYTAAKVYSRLGTWASLAKHESEESILQQYFFKAEKFAEDCDQEHVYHAFAHFCDAASHGSSINEDLEDLGRMRAQRQREVSHLKAAASETKGDKDGINRKLYHAQRALASESVDYTSLLNRKKQLVLKSVESYIKSMVAGDSYEGDMNRFVALWLELVSDASANELIYRLLTQDDSVILLSKKFLPWMNQLSSRLGKSETWFQRSLQLVISTALQRHPYHCLWQLVNLYWSATTTDPASVERKSIAKTILERARSNARQSRLLRDCSACAKQMLTLMKIQVDKKLKTLSLKNLGTDIDRWWRRDFVHMDLPVPTSTVKPQSNGDYSGVATVVNVNSEVNIAGGLSSPKIITLLDSTGEVKHMVLKHGTDDLRQDAIMQQVFSIVNELLVSPKGQKIRVRTYNVIPLGPAGGAIEFVEGTRSLQEILEPLHKSNGGSKEFTLAQARGIMRDVQRGDRSARVGAFKDVMEHTLPQMRKFWPSQMPDIKSWLTTKTAWCRSTAVMSIVGFVVGLGDRHCSNLLVDTVTGEVVHIDLGIAFDQGRLLSVPETVPFRLTRDMVDGMGVHGVDGPFTLSARTTLALIREQQSHIMTVLEVLKHDALYSWRLPPLRAEKVKVLRADEELTRPLSMSTTTGQAESALRGVKQKLSSNLNVEATVRDLVARSRDTTNLALMFCGWSPFY